MKKQLLIIILFLLVLNFFPRTSLAQAPGFKWAKSAGSISDDFSNAIAVDPTGNSYVTGTFQSPTIAFGSIILTNSGGPGNSNMFIVKYDVNGTAVWAKSLAGNCMGQAITVDTNGNSIVTGSFFGASITIGSTILTDPTWGYGYSDVFIAEYDSNGNSVWAKSAGGNNSETASGIAVDENGNSYIIGSFTGLTMTFGTTTISNTGSMSSNIFIAKYDSTGNLIWVNSVGGNDLDYGVGICVDSVGSVYITGHFVSATIAFGTTILTNVGSTTDFYIAKYDTNGNALWAKDAGNSNYDYASNIAVDKNGNSCAVGFSYGPSITFGSTTLNGSGTFVVQYDINGNETWAQWIGQGNHSRVHGIDTDDDNNFYVTGESSYTVFVLGNDTLINNYGGSINDDVFVVKYATDGHVIWAKSAGGPEDETSVGIGVDRVGNSYITGTFHSLAMYIGTDYLTNEGPAYLDLFVAKLGCSASPVPTISSSGSTYFCSGDSIILTASSAASYIWNTTSTSQSIVVSNSGNYVVSINDTNGCAATSLPTSIYVSPTPDATINGATSFCEGGSIILSVDAATSYSWSTGETSQSIVVSAIGTYSVTATNSDGCSSSSSQTITVNPLPGVSFDIGIDTLCLYSQTINLSGENPAGGTYSGSGITGNTFNPAMAGLGTHIISYYYTDNNGCGNYADDTVKVTICSGINELTNTSSFTISPNPFTSETIFSFNDFQKNTLIKIIDSFGKEVKTITFTGKQIVMERGNLGSGIYFVCVEYGNYKTENKKLIIQ